VTAFAYSTIQWTWHAAPRARPGCFVAEQNNWLAISIEPIDVASIAAVVCVFLLGNLYRFASIQALVKSC
jgi:hypothetical protein